MAIDKINAVLVLPLAAVWFLNMALSAAIMDCHLQTPSCSDSDLDINSVTMTVAMNALLAFSCVWTFAVNLFVFQQHAVTTSWGVITSVWCFITFGLASKQSDAPGTIGSTSKALEAWCIIGGIGAPIVIALILFRAIRGNKPAEAAAPPTASTIPPALP